MPGLDDFYRYIEKQEKGVAAGAGTAAREGKNGAGTPGTVRYVLRGGVTVPEVISEPALPELAEAEPILPPVLDAPSVSETEEKPSLPASNALGVGDEPPGWHRLPRHILLLATLSDESEEEVAAKYYTRGFKETRHQLIERLLDPTLTLEETARVLGVCPATVRRYTNRGVLPHYRTIGQQRRFRLSDVLVFMEKQQAEGGRRTILARDDREDQGDEDEGV